MGWSGGNKCSVRLASTFYRQTKPTNLSKRLEGGKNKESGERETRSNGWLRFTIYALLFSDKKENRMRNEVTELSHSKVDEKGVSDPVPISPVNDVQLEAVDWKTGENMVRTPTRDMIIDTLGEVNMEASITTDIIIRAGGFGARDEIGSFLPVASDSTDFEATIRDARDYEESTGEISRPGWAGQELKIQNNSLFLINTDMMCSPQLFWHFLLVKL